MADSQIEHVRRSTQAEVPQRMYDLGDGTYAAAVGSAEAFEGWYAGVWTTTSSADASGGVDVTAAPTAGEKLVVDDVLASSAAALALTFSEETSGTVVFVLYLAAGSTAQFAPRGKLKLATADKKLRVTASGAGQISVTVLYHSEA